jgi:hypothetical protein
VRLDRNEGRGKYAILNLRNLDPEDPVFSSDAIDYGDRPETEFFVIKLKDKYASAALQAYAVAARADDPEYADDVMKLAYKADLHPDKKKPD